MKNAYTLQFGKEIQPVDVLNNLPAWCRYPLTTATEATFSVLKKGHLLSQKLNLKPFLIDIVELYAEEPISFPISITENRIFFYFSLNGGVRFGFQNGEEITQVKQNYFYVSHFSPCKTIASVPKGTHLAIAVSLDTDWVDVTATEFDILKKFVSNFRSLSQQYYVLPHCRMDKQVHHWLREIYTFTRNNRGALDGLLRLYISLALEHYHKLLQCRAGMLAHRVKRYLDEHFCDPDLGYSKLCDIFHTTERTLANQYKAEFYTTIHYYYTRLRLERANYLIETQHQQIKDVYLEVGYNDESTFRNMYNKYRKQRHQ